MLRLPDPTRALLKSFGLAVSVASGLMAGLVLWLVGARYFAIWGLLLALIGSATALLWPSVAAGPYRGWDRLTRVVGRAARLWLTANCFLILAVVGRLGSRLAWRSPSPSDSGWVPKSQPADDSYSSMSAVPDLAGDDAGWARSLVFWAGRSGHIWAWSLVPMLVLLKAVEGSPRGSLGGNVYTLY